MWVEARYCHQVTHRTLLNREYLTYRLAQGLVVSYCGGRCGALVMHIYRNLLHTVNSEVKRSIGFWRLPSAVQAQPGLLQAWLGSKLWTPICPPPLKKFSRIYTFLTGAFSDYKMPENRLFILYFLCNYFFQGGNYPLLPPPLPPDAHGNESIFCRGFARWPCHSPPRPYTRPRRHSGRGVSVTGRLSAEVDHDHVARPRQRGHADTWERFPTRLF